MEIAFSERAKDELDFWKKSGNQNVLTKIRKLLESIQHTPYEGIGKPEPLKYDFTGQWSRRITEEHRMVYSIEDNLIIVHQVRFHY
jgi:toxin YoeB